MATVALGFQISASATQMAGGINTAAVELQKLGYAAKKTSNDVQTLKTIEIGKVFITSVQTLVAAVGRAQDVLGGFVSESVSIGEEASKSNVIFGESADAVQRFAESASEIGLSTRAALQATGQFGNLFTAIGLSQERAADLSVEMTRLASDLASFNNTTTDEAILALGAALRGEAEPIRRYGVLLNDATLKQVAFQRGLTGSLTGALDPAVKAQAAYFAILKQTTNAQGDFLRTSGSLANQQRVLGAEFSNVSAAIGTSLQPVFQQFVTGLRDALPAFEQAGVQIAQFLRGIDFGALVGASVNAFSSLVGVATTLAAVLQPIANNILPAIGGALFFINRQAIAAGIASLASTFVNAAKAMQQFGVSSLFAAGTVTTLKTALRGAALATGIGAVGVAVGFAAEQLVDYLSSTSQAQVQTDEIGKEAAATAAQIAAGVKEALGGTADAAGGAASAIADATKELEEEEKAVQQILDRLQGQSNLAVDVAIQFGNEGFAAGVAYQEALREIKRQVESEILNATSAEQAGEAAKKTFDKTIDALKERQQLQQQLAEQERAIDEERLRTLSRADTGPLRFDDIRTSSGASQLAALNREDPAVAEAVKQTAELRKIREKLTALEAPPVDIVGN
jgi:hypothetical protein